MIYKAQKNEDYHIHTNSSFNKSQWQVENVEQCDQIQPMAMMGGVFE